MGFINPTCFRAAPTHPLCTREFHGLEVRHPIPGGPKTHKLVNELKKSLVIYSYSISKNFLKEVFSKANVRFTFTNDLQKASVIIGVTKHLQQNSNLNKFANEKKIPIYSFDQVSIYQLTKFMKAIT